MSFYYIISNIYGIMQLWNWKTETFIKKPSGQNSGYGISFVYEVLAKSDPELGIFTLKGEPIVREFNVIYLKHADVREKMEWFLWPLASVLVGSHSKLFLKSSWKVALAGKAWNELSVPQIVIIRVRMQNFCI